MDELPGIFIGKGEAPVTLALSLANRHGLIAGATGTGKTVTLQILAEGLSAAGVPVFAADVKGDLSGIALAGTEKPFLAERAQKIGLDPYVLEPHPAIFWDVFGKLGHPIRATVSEMGPLLLARLLDLNDVQEGVLNIAFRVADDEGLLLLDLKDLRAILAFLAENADQVKARYGNVSSNTVGAIQRGLLVLENQGGDAFFGEPALDLLDFMTTDAAGRGAINVLAADALMSNPRVYATFLLWMMSELFERLPEAGDLDKPKLVFFFDEAHLLFNDAPKALLEKITQVVRLIRSKGVGIYFITQNPQDVPEIVLAQLGNRIQHALRAYTPKEQKAVRVAAESFRANPAFKTEDAITEMGIGEALVSTLQKGGVPSIVERTLIRPPAGRMGPLSEEERKAIVEASPFKGKYDEALDRESAHEVLNGRREAEPPPPVRKAETRSGGIDWGARPAARPAPRDDGAGSVPRAGSVRDRLPEAQPKKEESGGWLSDIFGGGGGRRQSVGEAAVKSAARSVGSSLGREISRSILGGILGGRRR
ncbi:MAG: helicase HerA-like domain-containing protein [Alphaproteobacteria bacterium]